MEYINRLDTVKFRSTNDTWNQLMLNDPWSIGSVSYLSKKRHFVNKEDWESYYHASGEERERIISTKTESDQSFYQDVKNLPTNRDFIKTLSFDQKIININYGRTPQRLREKGEILYASVKNNGCALTLEDCIECVRFRVVCETWNGIILRENNTILTLKNQFPDYVYKVVDGDVDYKYAVDYEIYSQDKLKYAIQIKPTSYLGDQPYLLKARKANEEKNKRYKLLNNVEVYYIYADTKGNIQNPAILKFL